MYIYMCVWRGHETVQQKLTQPCMSTMLKKKEKKKSGVAPAMVRIQSLSGELPYAADVAKIIKTNFPPTNQRRQFKVP